MCWGCTILNSAMTAGGAGLLLYALSPPGHRDTQHTQGMLAPVGLGVHPSDSIMLATKLTLLHDPDWACGPLGAGEGTRLQVRDMLDPLSLSRTLERDNVWVDNKRPNQSRAKPYSRLPTHTQARYAVADGGTGCSSSSGVPAMQALSGQQKTLWSASWAWSFWPGSGRLYHA